MNVRSNSSSPTNCMPIRGPLTFATVVSNVFSSPSASPNLTFIISPITKDY